MEDPVPPTIPPPPEDHTVDLVTLILQELREPLHGLRMAASVYCVLCGKRAAHRSINGGAPFDIVDIAVLRELGVALGGGKAVFKIPGAASKIKAPTRGKSAMQKAIEKCGVTVLSSSSDDE